MTICCALADNFVELFIARAGVGLGEACLGPAAISIIADYFAPDRRGRALAVYQAGASIGVGTSMLIGGVILAAIGDAHTVKVPRSTKRRVGTECVSTRRQRWSPQH